MNLDQIIQKSEELIRWLDRQVDGLPLAEDSRRYRLAAGCLDMAMEHQKAMVVLVAKKLFGSAFSLIRLISEAYIRGIWLHRRADENELEKFVKGDVPMYAHLLDAVERLESHQDKVFSTIKQQSWAAMNAYTHTGFHQIVRRQKEASIEPSYDEAEIIQAVKFANWIGCLAAIAICDLCNNADVANTILERIKSAPPLESVVT
jgi:hypothetical protein